MGMTCWYANERQPQATVQLDMHFIDAVQIGEFVEAKCTVVRRTRSLVFMSGELVVGDARGRHRQRRVEDAGEGIGRTISPPSCPRLSRASTPRLLYLRED